MRRETTERGISTVIDATFALLLISASVLLLAVFMDTNQPDQTDHDQYDEATQLVETLNAMEVSANVSTANTLSGNVMHTRSHKGTAAELLAEAAVSEAKINGVQYMNTNHVDGIRGEILHFLYQSETTAQIHAVWEPSEHAPVRGDVVIGPDPPVGAEISVATLTMPSGLRGADVSNHEYYRVTANNPPADALIAAEIVEGYFPPIQSQYLLEQDSKEREHIEYRYKRAAHLLYRYGNATGADADAIDSQFAPDTNPDALVLNSILIEMLQKDIQTGSATQPETASPDMNVEITVRTW